MKQLYYLQSIYAAFSSLLSWQKAVYEMVKNYQSMLFTREGIDEFAERLQDMADGLKGRDRQIRPVDWDELDRYPYLSTTIVVGPGNFTIAFGKVAGFYQEVTCVNESAAVREKDLTVEEKLSACQELLLSITRSGYLPFASPSPSSSEADIKRLINDAVRRVKLASALHDAQYGRRTGK